jgi:hypothetical protein
MSSHSAENYVPSTFGYSLYPERETGFYVVCSDRMILDSINSMMKNKGFVGISDTAGRMHYMVDARAGAYAAVHHITKQACRKTEDSPVSNSCILAAAEEVMTKYEMDRGLLGTRIIRYILVQSMRDPSLMTTVSKRLYPLAGKEFGITGSQVERNLRYSLSRVSLYRQGFRNVHILQHLHDEVSALLVHRSDMLSISSKESI